MSGAAIQFIGQFIRYATITSAPDLGGAPLRFSYSLFSDNWRESPWFNATLLTLAVAGVLFAVRPSRRRAAFIVGFAGLEVGAFGYALLMLARTATTVRWGPGFFLNAAGIVIEACAAVVLFVSLWRSIPTRRPVSRSTAQLAMWCAILLGLSTVIWPTVLTPGGSIARYGPWTIGSTVLAVAAFLSAAALLLLAARLSDRAGASVATGVAVALTIAVLDAFNIHVNGGVSLSDGPSYTQQLTIGFWCAVAALGLSLVLRWQLRQSAHPMESEDQSTIPSA